MKIHPLRIAVAFSSLLAAALAPGCAPSPEPVQIAAAPASRTPRIVEFSGDAATLGAEHGRQLSSEIEFLQRNYLDVFLGAPERRAAAGRAAMAFAPHLDPAHLIEIRALAQASGMSEADAMLSQAFLDLSPMVACSTIALPASASNDGIARMGRNLDFPALNVADKRAVVMIFAPADRYAFAAVTWPGMIGVLSGMNQHGLALANMEVTRDPLPPRAMPYTLLYRTLLERCRTVSEAIDLLERTPRQTPNNLMLMDASGDRAVVEITPQRITVRRAQPNQPLLSTNHHRGQDCDTRGFCVRYDTLLDQGTAQWGALDPASLQRILAAAAQTEFTIQSMIFEPTTRVIHLSLGADASRQQFHRIDLTPHF